MREEAIFLEALDMVEPAAREAFLAQACGDDATLRADIEALLAAHEEDNPLDRTIERPVLPTLRINAGPIAPGGLLAGRYFLGEPLGEGGMGLVYRAEQVQPVQRAVALKLIRGGLDSERVLARFEAERQALAVMDHPGIAKVLDAGTLPEGAPFFVMELVEGSPLTTYCDAQRITVPERLALFVAVCRAVQHAHQKGIIHRDLKPSNILVTTVDRQPVPKIIDFGLAKALAVGVLPDLTYGEMPSVKGTPLYMAPEQADPHTLDIDTRSDIYALGAILYELLSGSTPLAKETLANARIETVLEHIRMTEPPTLGQRVQHDPDTVNHAAQRRVTPERLAQLVRGELDWITQKALAKERHRRYDSAHELARDIERYLHHEPVLAGPPSRSYIVRKFVRRHRKYVVAGTLLVAVLVAGVIGTTWGLISAEQARTDEAEQRLVAEQKQREATAAEAKAKAEAERAEQVAGFLVGLFESREQLAFFSFNLGFRNNPKDTNQALSFLAQGIERLHTDPGIQAQPFVKARLLYEMAIISVSIGQPERAMPLAREALTLRQGLQAKDHPDVLKCLRLVAQLEFLEGDYGTCIACHREIIALLEQQTPAESLDLADTKASLATGIAIVDLKEAVQLTNHAYEIHKRLLGPTNFRTISTGWLLALLRAQNSEPLSALALATRLRADLEAGNNHPELSELMKAAFAVFFARGPQEIPAYRDLAAKTQKVFGPEHFITFRAKTRLASVLYDRSTDDAPELVESARLTEEVLTVGPKWERTYSRFNLGRTLMRLRRYDEALNHLEQAVAEFRQQHVDLQANHLPHGLQLLARLYALQEDRDAASAKVLEEAVRVAQANPRTKPARLGDAIMELGCFRLGREPWKPTRELFADAVKVLTQAHGSSDVRTLEAQAFYMMALRQENQFPEADKVRAAIERHAASYQNVRKPEAAHIRQLLNGRIPRWR